MIAGVVGAVAAVVALGPLFLRHGDSTGTSGRQDRAPVAGLGVPHEVAAKPTGAAGCGQITDPADFVSCYYGLMPRTAQGWAYIGAPLDKRTKRGITPRQSYDEYWRQYGSVDVRSATDVGPQAVAVVITLHGIDGVAHVTERHELTVGDDGSGLRIVGDVLLGH